MSDESPFLVPWFIEPTDEECIEMVKSGVFGQILMPLIVTDAAIPDKNENEHESK